MARSSREAPIALRARPAVEAHQVSMSETKGTPPSSLWCSRALAMPLRMTWASPGNCRSACSDRRWTEDVTFPYPGGALSRPEKFDVTGSYQVRLRGGSSQDHLDLGDLNFSPWVQPNGGEGAGLQGHVAEGGSAEQSAQRVNHQAFARPPIRCSCYELGRQLCGNGRCTGKGHPRECSVDGILGVPVRRKVGGKPWTLGRGEIHALHQAKQERTLQYPTVARRPHGAVYIKPVQKPIPQLLDGLLHP